MQGGLQSTLFLFSLLWPRNRAKHQKWTWHHPLLLFSSFFVFSRSSKKKGKWKGSISLLIEAFGKELKEGSTVSLICTPDKLIKLLELPSSLIKNNKWPFCGWIYYIIDEFIGIHTLKINQKSISTWRKWAYLTIKAFNESYKYA